MADDNLTEVGFVWRQGSGRQHPVTGEPGAGDIYTATIGPPDPSGPVTWWVIAADDDGNEVTSGAQTLRVADTCG